MSGEPRVTVRGFRQVVQDLLVPELRSIQTEITHLKEEIKTLRVETKEEMRLMRAENRETRELTLRILERLDASAKYSELSERLARIEEKLNL